jgi:hypothetical protein
MTTQADLPTANRAQPMVPLPTPELEAEVNGLRALQAKGDHNSAAAGANRLLEAHPANRDLLLTAALL